MWRVLPTVLDQAGWVTIDLGGYISLAFVGKLVILAFEQVSHLKMTPFFPSFGRLTLTPIPSSLASASKFERSGRPSLPGLSPDFGGDKERVARDAKVDAAVWTAVALSQQVRRGVFCHEGQTYEGRVVASRASDVLLLDCPSEDIRRCL